ncbi:MAG: hypothetical protein A2902_07840 [Elusimicrobia bacterium RIFCSPLOWO2_01_FULL_64_13]|nr:MAG: hypothetical protein A2902_07840 [Elusimicrobia bacterium RIFCSPLOWO2_01_FULL_64_13]
MEKELARSLKRLKFEDFGPPYFLSYQILDSRDENFSARHGARVQDSSNRSRYFYVELRYGGRGLDNTQEDYRGLSDSAPLDESPDDARHRLWLLTDQAYKQAVNDTLAKRGKRLTEPDKEKTADFSREEPVRAVLPDAGLSQDIGPYKKILAEASAGFKAHPWVVDSGVSFREDRDRLAMVNSEGTRLAMPKGGNPYFVYVWARSQTGDGMNLNVSRSFSARSISGLPGAEALAATIREMAAQLEKLRAAPAADPYTGPAILDPESTGVLFHEAVGHRLEGERQRDEDEGQTFKGQAGRKVIPEFLTVIDDPTVPRWRDTDLNGSYAYDDEGVPAQKAVLIENGVLKNYLLSRRPIPGFPRSNGHGRAQFGRDPIGRMSNLFVKSSREVPFEKLKAMLLEECRKKGKPYGLIIRRTRSGDTFTGRGRYQAFRGTPEEVVLVDAATGEEKWVRGVEIVGTPLITVNKIIATGSGSEALNAFCAAESGTIPVSSVAPWSLVEEVELQRVREDKQRPPILPPPLHDH